MRLKGGWPIPFQLPFRSVPTALSIAASCPPTVVQPPPRAPQPLVQPPVTALAGAPEVPHRPPSPSSAPPPRAPKKIARGPTQVVCPMQPPCRRVGAPASARPDSEGQSHNAHHNTGGLHNSTRPPEEACALPVANAGRSLTTLSLSLFDFMKDRPWEHCSTGLNRRWLANRCRLPSHRPPVTVQAPSVASKCRRLLSNCRQYPQLFHSIGVTKQFSFSFFFFLLLRTALGQRGCEVLPCVASL